MSSLKLEFPVLVQVIKKDKEKYYKVSPLFLREHAVKNERFEKSIRNLKNQIRNNIKSINIERYEMNYILWYLFNPDIHFEIIKLDFTSGKFAVQGEFSVASFTLKNQTFICLPGFDKFMFIAESKSGKVNVKEQASEMIMYKINEERKKLGEKWKASDYIVSKNEFITVIDLDVFIKHADLPFDQDFSSLFASLFSVNEEMYGADEIEKVGSDLNLKYPDELNRASYRDDLVERISQLIYQDEKTAFVLIGPTGSGKTTVIQEAIYKYLEKNESKQFNHLEKVWDIDPVRVIAGMKIIGMWQKRLETILDFVINRLKKDYKSKGQDKLYIRNMVALLRVGKSAQNNMTLSDVLKTFLEKRKVTMIGEATLEEWKVVQELDRKFADLFQVIRIPEMPYQDSIKAVLYERARLEHENNCKISNLALNEIFNLQRVYMKQNSLPGSVVSFLKRITTKYRNSNVDKAQVLKTFQEVHPVSLQMLDKSNNLDNKELESFIRKHLIGQEEAIDCIVNTIHLIKANLNNPEKPYGVFLFIGPTGVGKTEAAKIMSKYLFGNDEQLVRFDMNEFIDYGATSRLVGDIFHPEGQLTGKIRNQPFSVLLFDEIEKAHFSIHNLLLQILGEGRLTDAIGRTVDFTNTVIIMTSNLGAKEAGKMFGFSSSNQSISSTFKKAVEDFFAPEFINRIDRIVPFKHLELKDIMLITRLQIQELLQRDGFVRRNMILNINDDVIDSIAKQGFDINYGARALKRSIEKNLIALTADQIVSVPLGKPMIFEISLVDGQIFPEVTVLDEITPNANFNTDVIPDEKFIIEFLKDLLNQIEDVQEKISNYLEQQPENISYSDNWGIYNLKTQLMELKEEIFSLISDLEIKNNPIQIVRTPKFGRRMGYQERTNLFNELFAQMDIREYLYETFQKAHLLISNSKAAYFQYLLDVFYLKFFTEKLSVSIMDNVLIKIKPLSLGNSSGKHEIDYLESFYSRILRVFDFPVKVEEYKDGHIEIITQGIRLYDFLKGEIGVHMFFVPHQNYVPVQVDIIPSTFEDGTVKPVPYQVNNLNDYRKIIRYYCIPYDSNLSDDTITDLKTGMMMKSKLSDEEIKVLMYANVI